MNCILLFPRLPLGDIRTVLPSACTPAQDFENVGWKEYMCNDHVGLYII